MPIHELAALAASLCFATGGLFAVAPSRALGAVRFNRIRMLMMAVVLTALAILGAGFDTITTDMLWPLVLSAVVGITLGDTFLFAGLRRVGPRRNAVMFAFNAPIAALLGAWLLGELLSTVVLAGCALVSLGVIVAIAFGRRPAGDGRWDIVQGSLPLGLFFGFLAATGQALGLLLSRPAMEAGADPIAASALRVAVGCISLLMVYEWQQRGRARDHSLWTRSHVFQTLGSSAIGMGLGMTLVMFALSGGKTGVVATLSSCAPLAILPLLWITSGQRPAWGAWLGAGLLVAGTALIFQ